MVDDKTYKIEKSDFINTRHKLKKTKIEKFRNALKSIHTNLFVSETTIYPLGIV